MHNTTGPNSAYLALISINCTPNTDPVKAFLPVSDSAFVLKFTTLHLAAYLS